MDLDNLITQGMTVEETSTDLSIDLGRLQEEREGTSQEEEEEKAGLPHSEEEVTSPSHTFFSLFTSLPFILFLPPHYRMRRRSFLRNP